MNVVLERNPNHFLEMTLGFLEQEEAINLLALGIIIRLAKVENALPSGVEPLLFVVEDGGHIRAVCIVTPPRRLILSCPDDADVSVIGAVCRYLAENDIRIPGAVGPANVTERFAAAWSSRVGCSMSISMRQMIHRIDSVNDITVARGRLVIADTTHEALVAGWLREFARITPEQMTQQQARSAARAAIAESRVHLWLAPRPVSMAAWTRPTRHGVAVTWVYTPPEYREHGYATSTVAAMTHLLLETRHDFCALYTDLANPTSNSIYRKIGYIPIQESIVCDFL